MYFFIKFFITCMYVHIPQHTSGDSPSTLWVPGVQLSGLVASTFTSPDLLKMGICGDLWVRCHWLRFAIARLRDCTTHHKPCMAPKWTQTWQGPAGKMEHGLRTSASPWLRLHTSQSWTGQWAGQFRLWMRTNLAQGWHSTALGSWSTQYGNVRNCRPGHASV